MANEMQRGNLTGTAIMRIPISGTVNISGKQMKELRFMPYSEFPEEGREDVLYIDTDGNAMYYWDGTEYIALSGGGGGGTGDYNELSNKPQINGNVLTGNKTAANLGLQETISDLATIRSGAASGSTAVQPAALETALSTKQDVISDLASIRSGASKGDTAVQPSDMESALSEKQDTISDLQMIRSGAALGVTAVQPSDLETALADKQDVISDLDAIRSGATAGNTALQPEDVDTLPTDGSSNPVSSGGTYNFVNSSIATNTAYFIGTFASVAELEAYTGTVTNNDYAFVTSTDSAGNTLYNRYKYNAATLVWSFEYAVNNTAFTAAQWAAIQSGLTSSDKTKLDGIEQGANKTVIDATPTSGSSNAVSSGGVHTALSGKQDTISDLSDIRSGAAAGATALHQSDVSSTYSESGTAPVNGTAVSDAIGTLDVSSVGGAGKYISEISETGGKITATPTNFDTALSSSSTDGNVPTSKTVYDDQQRQETEIGDIANRGAKNLLNPNLKSKTVDGVTYTLQSDGRIIANGTAASASFVASFYGGQFTIPAGDWLLNGCPSGGSTASYMVQIKDNSHPENPADGTVLYRDFGTGDVLISISTVTTFMYVIRVVNGYTANNVMFKPMIRPAAIIDPTFQPYALPNPVLTPAAIKAVDEGAKNIADFTSATKTTYTTATFHGVTITRNGDIFTISGTSDTNDNAFFNIYYEGSTTTKIIPPGNWVALIEDYTGSVVKDIAIQIAAPAVPPTKPYGTPIKFSLSGSESGNWLRVNLRPSTTYNGSFRLMICTAADWAVSQKFVPYAPTNRELYESKADVSQVFGRGIALKTTDDCNDKKEVGMYYAPSSSEIPASNSPFINAGFRMRVEKWYQSLSGTTGVIQIADTFASTTYTEKRRLYFYTGGGVGWRWTDWVTTINVSMTVPAT